MKQKLIAIDLFGSNAGTDIATVDLPVVGLPENRRVIKGECIIKHLFNRSSDGRVERGIWEISACTVEDIEMDEMLVVISGYATVEFFDGGEPMELKPGTLGILKQGTHTRWIVHEKLRKAYQQTLNLSQQ